MRKISSAKLGAVQSPEWELQSGKNWSEYQNVIEPDLAFDIQVERERNGPIIGESARSPSRLGSMVMNEEEEAKKRPPKRYFQREFSKGGSVNSKASSRADGCAQRGKTKGRFV